MKRIFTALSAFTVLAMSAASASAFTYHCQLPKVCGNAPLSINAQFMPQPRDFTFAVAITCTYMVDEEIQSLTEYAVVGVPLARGFVPPRLRTFPSNRTTLSCARSSF